jgi:MutS domain V
MKARLLYRNRDFEWRSAFDAADERRSARLGRRGYRNVSADLTKALPWNWRALTTDLALDVLFSAMAGDEDYVHEIARRVILEAVTGDVDTVRYRQDILRDCLRAPHVIRELYDLAVTAMENRADGYLGYLGALVRHPDSVLRSALEQMAAFVKFLRKLGRIGDRHAAEFTAAGWTEFFAMLQRDLGDNYLDRVERELNELRFRYGVLLSAKLGRADKARNFLLHRSPIKKGHWMDWWRRLFRDQPHSYRFDLHPRDEAGGRALAEIRDRGLGLAASALAQSADHVRNFFRMLRAELAFYVGCINLHERLSHKDEPTCFPLVASIEERRLSFRGLYDVGLSLTRDQRVIGNTANADGKSLIVITGPNTGGKSTLMRGLGLAQLMMQSGMFVGADAFSGSVCDGLFTHYRREEDVAMESGKFDEELQRMSEIVDHITPRSIVLFNESFAATNEREGSEIGRQVISALLERGVRALCVTHMFELAHGFYSRDKKRALFLRAVREAGGGRTFKLSEGEPLPTSFGEDLYNAVFATKPPRAEVDAQPPAGSAISEPLHEAG